ncbi:hypothetical protein M6B38_149945 [Iris pallida]|uniref:Uncharacterized protein n=1 Tax=Iris pallida TaxID=29817 RepID=A0AAX6F7L2_IRIPA|nr:hypothetical protein M6B38_149945 [Iris pallida]
MELVIAWILQFYFSLYFWRLYLRDSFIVYYFIGPDLSPAEFVF